MKMNFDKPTNRLPTVVSPENFEKTPNKSPIHNARRTFDTSEYISDESPFETYGNSASFALYLEPMLNPYYKTYQNIITLNAIPPGPLGNMVIHINTPKLSEFHTVSANAPPPSRTGGRCVYALMRFPKGSRNQSVKHANAYMGAHDIPSIYGYLKANGYRIDTTLTKMTFHIDIDYQEGYSGNRKLICIVDV